MTQTEKSFLIVTTAKQVARLALVGGTLIFLSFALSKHEVLISVGVIFTVLMAAINGLLLSILFIHFIAFNQCRRQILHTAILMFCNVPTAIFYAWLTIQISQLHHIK